MIRLQMKVRAATTEIYLSLLLFLFGSSLQGEPVPKDLIGSWSLDLETDEPVWMRIVEQDGKLLVYMRIHVGSVGPYEVTEVSANGQVKFTMDRRRKKNMAWPLR